jgi:hypothetical protein
MSRIGTSDFMLDVRQRDGLAMSLHAFSTCELKLEIIALSIFGHSPGWRRVAAGFFVCARISTRFLWPMV